MASAGTPLLLDAQQRRREFPILDLQIDGRSLVYLDNGATSQKPQSVLDVLQTYWTAQNANIHRGVHHLSQLATREYDAARETVRVFLNAAQSREIIFTKGCTESVNLVAHGLARNGTLGEGDTVLVSLMEHHSNIVPWQLEAERVGAKVLPIPITERGEIDLDAYDALLRANRVKVVGIVHVSNSLGTVNPVKEIVARAHAAGALVLVDGAQAGPHTLVDVQDLDADFYTLSCHKMYAPTGVGVLYGKRALLEALPPYQGGGDMIRVVSFERTTFAELPAKFEAGTPNIAGVIGLGAAIRYIAGLSGHETFSRDALADAFELIGRHEHRLTVRATDALQEIPGLRITGTAPQKAGIVAFTLPHVHPHDIGTILDQDGIAIRAGHHCCMPLMRHMGVPATARASFALYNTEEEVDALVASVRKAHEMFA